MQMFSINSVAKFDHLLARTTKYSYLAMQMFSVNSVAKFDHLLEKYTSQFCHEKLSTSLFAAISVMQISFES
jgi:hypothetical protein